MKRSPSRFLYSTRTSSWPLPAFFTPPNLTSSSLTFLPPCRKLSSVKPPTPSLLHAAELDLVLLDLLAALQEAVKREAPNAQPVGLDHLLLARLAAARAAAAAAAAGVAAQRPPLLLRRRGRRRRGFLAEQRCEALGLLLNRGWRGRLAAEECARGRAARRGCRAARGGALPRGRSFNTADARARHRGSCAVPAVAVAVAWAPA